MTNQTITKSLAFRSKPSSVFMCHFPSIPFIILFPCFLYSSSLVVEKVDVTTIDYCKFKCIHRDQQGNIVESLDTTVCHCLRKYSHREELQDLQEFRTYMLDTHNKLRNNLAGGKVKHKSGKYYPTASNMRAVSYSEELEYSARCWAVQVYDYHDECRATSKFENVGQNLHFHEDTMYPWKISMWGWWSEYNKYKPELVDKFQIPPGASGNDVGHFVQIAWAQMYQVGCARSYNPYNNKSANVFHFASLCNYGTFGYGSNVISYPIYKTGKPCSQCQAEYNLSCNKKYPNLCGEVDPIPTDPPVPMKVSCDGISKKLCDEINESTKPKPKTTEKIQTQITEKAESRSVVVKKEALVWIAMLLQSRVLVSAVYNYVF